MNGTLRFLEQGSRKTRPPLNLPLIRFARGRKNFAPLAPSKFRACPSLEQGGLSRGVDLCSLPSSWLEGNFMEAKCSQGFQPHDFEQVSFLPS